MKSTLRYISVVYVMLLSVGLFAHVEIIPGLLSLVKRDSWISVLLMFLVLPFVIFFLAKIISVTKKGSIITLLDKQNRKAIYILLLFPLAIYMVMNAIITAKDIIIWSQLSYMPGFNSFSLAFVLILFCLICTESGFISIGILSSFLCPLVIFLGWFITFSNMKKKNYELLIPIFEDGYAPAIQGLVLTALPLLELFVLVFLTPYLKNIITKKQLTILGIFIIILTLGPTIGAITEFGPKQAGEYRYPAYEQWRLMTIGKYFTHADFFAIFQWLSGGVIRISFFILIASLIYSKAKINKKVIRVIYGFAFLICIYPIDQDAFFSIVYGYIRPISFILLTFNIAFLSIYIWKNVRRFSGDESETP